MDNTDFETGPDAEYTREQIEKFTQELLSEPVYFDTCPISKLIRWSKDNNLCPPAPVGCGKPYVHNDLGEWCSDCEVRRGR